MISRAFAATIVLALAATAAPLTLAPEFGWMTATPGDSDICGGLKHVVERDGHQADVASTAADRGAAPIGSTWADDGAGPGFHANVARRHMRGTTPLPECPVAETSRRGSRSLCRSVRRSTQ